MKGRRRQTFELLLILAVVLACSEAKSTEPEL